MKMKAVDLSPITAELPGAAFGLFRYWNKSILPGEKILLRDEQVMAKDLARELIASCGCNKRHALAAFGN
jgi:hypothetical protein